MTELRHPLASRLGSRYATPLFGTTGDANNHGMLVKLERELLDRQPVVTRCAFCRWYYSGPLFEGRSAFRSHAAERHPGLVKKRRVRCKKHDCSRWASVKSPPDAQLCKQHLADAYERAGLRQGGWGIGGSSLTIRKAS